MRKRNIFLLLLAISVVVGLFLVLHSKSQELSKGPPINIDRIILVTIDTLRADHLGVYGYPRNTSPFIDKLAKESVVFTSAFASMAETASSHASIFTSLYPLQHVVLQNGMKLDDSFLTMAEMLTSRKYFTVAFVSIGVHFIPGNIHQGFRAFYYPRTYYYFAYSPAKATMDTAIEALKKDLKTDRFFLWVHLFDPHDPLRPPKRFLKTFTNLDKREKSSLVAFLLNEHKIDLDYYNNSSKYMLRTINEYDAEILYVDTQIERLYKFMEKQGLNRNSLWIITSDHGEGLGNHEWYGHGKYIYNEQIRVPLIFHFPSNYMHGLTIDTMVEHVDILPTISELVGGDLTKQVQPVQGTSLVPLLTGNHKAFPEKFAFSQRRAYSSTPPEVIDPKKINYEHGEKFALQDKNYKYIYRTEGEDEFFALQKDPYEQNNLAGQNPEEEQRFKSRILHMVNRFTDDRSVEPQMTEDKEILERLRSLGYLQ